MPDFKIDLLFQDRNRNRSVGWAEGLYLKNYATHQDARTEALTMAGKRVQMLGRGVILHAVRVSDIAIPGDSLVDLGLAPAPNGIYNQDFVASIAGGLEFTTADYPWAAMECRVEGTHLYRRAYFLSGSPDELQKDDDALIIDNVWKSAFSRWVNHVKNPGNRWSFKVRDKDSGTVPIKPVTAFAIDTGTFTCVNHGYLVGDTVSFRNGGFTPRLTGQFQIVSKTADTFTLSHLPAALERTGRPGVQQVQMILTQITSVQQNYYGQKKRGGVSGAVRGRRPTR